MKPMQISPIIFSTLLVFFMNGIVLADQELRDIQKRFNAGTLSKPFSVPTDAALNAALKEATQRGTPTRTPGFAPNCVGLGCVLGQNFGYGSFFGGYPRPYYGGLYGAAAYNPYYSSW